MPRIKNISLQKRKSLVTTSNKFEEKWMQRAILFANKAPNPSPNPKVGCVILQNGKIVGEGFHKNAGESHAEIIALKKAGTKAKGATLFVTLEPCHHFGRTPPCSAAILKAGIKKVFIGMSDLNPTATGGADFLRKNGVEIEVGILESECRDLNQVWLKNISKRLPFVALKLAVDEKNSTIPSAGRKWITSEKSRREVMKMRRSFDAIAVGVGTIVADDPRLTVRGLKITKQPVRIIFDPNLRTPAAAQVLNDGGETILVSHRDFKSLDLRKVLRQLFDRGICSIFLEGGLTTAERFLKKDLVDRVLVFQNKPRGTPKVCGKKLALKKIGKFGEDTLYEAVLKSH